jgi:hypothetical protein
MADPLSSSGARTPLSFEDFVEAATAAALRAATRVAAADDPNAVAGGPAERFKLPWPIWIGLIINNREIQGIETGSAQK